MAPGWPGVSGHRKKAVPGNLLLGPISGRPLTIFTTGFKIARIPYIDASSSRARRRKSFTRFLHNLFHLGKRAVIENPSCTDQRREIH